ncbi:MAG: hypothetical protein Q4A93_06000 [Actinomycetota bacterium]|nr:hypothetical protein [Actinomycetota bacterium]
MQIDAIDVHDGFLEAEVSCQVEELYVSPALAGRMVSVLPELPHQQCVNSGHRYFGDEIVGTELPHLLEHVAIELMVCEARWFSPETDRVYVGNTSWHRGADEGAVRRMRVTISFDDDLVALSALKQASELIEWGMRGGGSAPDVPTLVRALHDLRDL